MKKTQIQTLNKPTLFIMDSNYLVKNFIRNLKNDAWLVPLFNLNNVICCHIFMVQYVGLD